MKDFSTGRTEPITLQTNGPFNRAAHAPVLSANGRYVVTSMLQLPYFVAYTAATFDIIWIDLLTAERRTLMGGQLLNDSLYLPPLPTSSLSADGQVVAYSDVNNVYVKNMATGSNTLASAKADGTPMNSSRDPVISADGHYVLFVSNQTLFIRDMLVRTNRAIGSHFRNPVFSRDLAYVLSSSAIKSVVLYDISNRSSSTICQSCENPSMSGDGKLIAYEQWTPGGAPRQIMLRNGSTNLITKNVMGTGAGNDRSLWPVLSHDGRFLVFVSKASDLTLGDTNSWVDLFVRDLTRGTTLRITGLSNNSGHGSGPASRPVLGPDGRTLVFRSFASDFVDGDYNDQRDLFLLRLNAGDSDDDGLPDDWEMAYFDDLSALASGDMDSDGHNNLQEYTAGTDPTDKNSVFQVISLTSQSGQMRLFWSAVPGATYRVEYKNDPANAGWVTLPGLVVATNSTGSRAVASAPPHGKSFYRVVLIE